MDNRLKQFVIGNDGVWPNNGPHGKYCLFGGVDLLVDHEAFMKARAELENKPSWDDAPEWARCLAQDSDGGWWWYDGHPVQYDHWWGKPFSWVDFGATPCRQCEKAARGRAFGDWRDTLEKRPEPKMAGNYWNIRIGGNPLEPQYQDVMDLINAIVEISQTADNTEDSEIQDALMDIVTRLGGILANRFTGGEHE